MTQNFIHIDDIQISEGRQRRTFDSGKHQELVESIQYGKAGLQNAPVLRLEGKQWFLVSGERRLRAIKDIYELGGEIYYAGEKVMPNMVPFTPLGELSEIDAMEAELDENIRRADLTWQEHAEAVAKLAKLRSFQTGIPEKQIAPQLMEELSGAGINGGSNRDTVRKEIIVAQHLDNPVVREAKSVKEAYKILKQEEKKAQYKELAEVVGKTHTASKHVCAHGDSLSWLEEQEDSQYDVILTDPPYGMGADSFGDSGGKAVEGHFYEDGEDVWSDLMDILPAESFRLAKADAHLYCFLDIDKFPVAKMLFAQAGWRVFRTPIIWHKPQAYRAPWPEHGPQRKYECILYAVKGDRKVNNLAPDVITCPPDENLGHPAQKPVALLVDLLKRSVRPGDKVLDPFCGSGSIFPAAHQLQCYATGVELDETAYGLSLSRIGELK